ncbi:unnamed protein product [Diatraea saccharalis]|uniref:Uncharacterized protein n=1 Tax=Diatraea saccharalis TaxID=40085 RepID=A0A9N9WJQ5_9NEOP|nr:unnamed protein product [Diatraea saccharalis]
MGSRLRRSWSSGKRKYEVRAPVSWRLARGAHARVRITPPSDKISVVEYYRCVYSRGQRRRAAGGGRREIINENLSLVGQQQDKFLSCFLGCWSKVATEYGVHSGVIPYNCMLLLAIGILAGMRRSAAARADGGSRYACARLLPDQTYEGAAVVAPAPAPAPAPPAAATAAHAHAHTLHALLRAHRAHAEFFCANRRAIESVRRAQAGGGAHTPHHATLTVRHLLTYVALPTDTISRVVHFHRDWERLLVAGERAAGGVYSRIAFGVSLQINKPVSPSPRPAPSPLSVRARSLCPALAGILRLMHGMNSYPPEVI